MLIAFAIFYGFITNPSEEEIATEMNAIVSESSLLNIDLAKYALANAFSGRDWAEGGFTRTNLIIASIVKITVPSMEGTYLAIWGNFYKLN